MVSGESGDDAVLLEAIERAKKAIQDDDVRALERLLEEEPRILAWRDAANAREVILQATTSYANWHGPDGEAMWNRVRCAELLLERGALVDPRVPLRALRTGAREMLALFDRFGVLPRNLRSFAARGLEERVAQSFEADGRLRDEARPEAELRVAYDGAAGDWPLPSDDSTIVADAFLFACRYGHRAIAQRLLDAYCRIDASGAACIERAGREAFLDRMLERAPGAAPFELPTRAEGADRDGGAREPSPLWRFAVEIRLHDALHEESNAALCALLRDEAWILDAQHVSVQRRFLEVAAYSPDKRRHIEDFLDAGAAILSQGAEHPSRAIEYALEYGNASYVPALARVWSVPRDLPTAAGLGDREALARFFEGDEAPQAVLDRGLAWAVQNRAFDAADDLLARGADINTRWGTHEPASILHEVAAAGRFEQVRWLVARGIDVTRRDARFGASAAEWADYGGHTEIRDYLNALG